MAQETSARRLGVAVHLADPKMCQALRSHLKDFDEQLQGLVNEQVRASIAEAIKAAEQETARTQAVIAALVTEISEAGARAETARELEAQQRDGQQEEAAALKSRLEALAAKATSVKRRLIAEAGKTLNGLRSEQGQAFEQIRENVLRRLDRPGLEQKWIEGLLDILEGARSITVRSDAEGRFRFGKAYESTPIIYTAVRDAGTGVQSDSTVLRDESYLWLDAVDTANTTRHDLGDFNSVSLKAGNFDAIRMRVAGMTGVLT